MKHKVAYTWEGYFCGTLEKDFDISELKSK
jgi:hypothetical protein